MSRTAAILPETLGNIVRLIQQRFASDVCSVYLLEPDRSTLVLAATIGLRPESVGRIRMRLSEGLAGLVGETLTPQVVENATAHPRFKYFIEAGEDAYHSFVGVPIVDRGLLQGVLVLQTVEPRAYSEDVVGLLTAAGAQVAPIVSEARTLGQFWRPRIAACRRSRRTCGGAGTRRRPACSAISTRGSGARSRTTRSPCCSGSPPSGWNRGSRSWACTAGSTTHAGACRSISRPRRPGACAMRACSGRGPSRISPPSSACTSRCPSTRAASASWRAITSRPRPIWDCRSWASDSYYEEG